MGTCYSKGSTSVKHLKSKAPKARRSVTKDGDESALCSQSMESTPILKVRTEEHDQTNKFDLVSGLDEQQGEIVSDIGDKGVAPSDSGIESIGLFVQDVNLSVEESSVLAKNRIERLSCGSCYKCGNFKLDDNALTALLSDSYCICGPRQAGKPSVNPNCQTHGVKKGFKRSESMPLGYNGENSTDFHSLPSSPVKSSMKRDDGEKKVKMLRISLENSLDVDDRNSTDNTESIRPNSSDVLNDSVSQKRLSRRSLLSEILDITDSICKCDFYSNEFCVGGKEKDEINDSNVTDTLESLALSGSFDSCSQPDNERLLDVESPIKSASVSKFVTFARPGNYCVDEDHIANEILESHSCPLSPVKSSVKRLTAYSVNSMSETSSGVDVNWGQASDSILSQKKKERMSPMKEPFISSLSNEAINCTGDDMASQDMDSLSRVTSLSYSSIRQLLESTEDLVEPLDSVRRMTINGEDCVIIPTQTYKQMQTDLDMLKEQLLCLSSLLQEESVSRNRRSCSFYSDYEATPTNRIKFRSQEFIDMSEDLDNLE